MKGKGSRVYLWVGGAREAFLWGHRNGMPWSSLPEEVRRRWACVSPPPDGYARLRVLGKGSRERKGAALQVERVRATDGEVLASFEISH